MNSGVRTALIAAASSVIVGIISGFVTYQTTQATVRGQLEAANLTHAKDIAGAVHDAVEDLFSSNAALVKTTLATLYFLGDSEKEREQIVETTGSAGTPQIRAAIAYVLNVDHTYGPAIASDPDVIQITVSQNAAQPGGNPTPPPSNARDVANPKTVNDALDKTITLLNGSGWVYLGLGPPTGDPAVTADQSIKQPGILTPKTLVTFSRALNFRQGAPEDSGFAPSIGTIQAGQSAVILKTKSYPFNRNNHALWAQVFLCNAPAGVQRPSEASACPNQTTLSSSS